MGPCCSQLRSRGPETVRIFIRSQKFPHSSTRVQQQLCHPLGTLSAARDPWGWDLHLWADPLHPSPGGERGPPPSHLSVTPEDRPSHKEANSPFLQPHTGRWMPLPTSTQPFQTLSITLDTLQHRLQGPTPVAVQGLAPQQALQLIRGRAWSPAPPLWPS